MKLKQKARAILSEGAKEVKIVGKKIIAKDERGNQATFEKDQTKPNSRQS